jgi:chromosome segregation ATPase
MKNQSDKDIVQSKSITSIIEKIAADVPDNRSMRSKESVKDLIIQLAKQRGLNTADWLEVKALEELRISFGDSNELYSDHVKLVNETITRLGSQIISIVEAARGNYENQETAIRAVSLQNSDLTKENKELQEKVDAWTLYKEKVERENEEQKVEIKKLKEEREKELEELKTTYERELKDARELRSITQKELDTIKIEWESKKRDLSALDEIHQTMRDKIAEIESLKERHQNQLDNQERTFAIEKTQAVFNKEMEMKEKYWSEMQQRIDEIKEKDRQEIESRESQILELKTILIGVQSDNKSLHKELNESNTYLRDFKNRVLELEQILETRDKEIKDLKEKPTDDK